MAISDLSTGDSRSPAKSPGSLPHPALSGSDRRGKRLTDQGNEAYAQGDISLALAAYTDALTEAERLFDAVAGDRGSVPVPVIFNISCHNLAELFERSGETAKAEACYQMAYDRLLETARCPSGPLELRIVCAQHLKHALAMLVQHLHRHGAADDRIGAIISKAHHAVYAVYQVAEHAAQADDSCAHCNVTRS
ncbi:hypothetical protein [Aquamicrobium sp.]|uniref:hypothetical protein n=1 Tax=Aquamicrobium sp. TaxID=1872579 RepID=UPI00258F127A|nr:hypothetical protein [Aquamicrobium sp.]MCK9550335.1 DUF2753 domain-containing protein [Aquamicrobium sp.]